jgi:AraC-like DNA-binding protein
MPTSVSTDPIRPAERQAFWTEAISRSFAPVDTRPLGSAVVSGHFEFVEMGTAKLVRFDSSPQCYSRDARLVSRAGSDEFMFDFQRRGRSVMRQAGREGTIEPGFGVLYDARRPFEDRLYGEEARSELLIATVPAAELLRALPDAERFCARPVPLAGAVARAIAACVGAAVAGTRTDPEAIDIVACLAALLRLASGRSHGLGRASLFGLIDAYLKTNIAALPPLPVIAARFGISERTLHRVFADRETTFERQVLHLKAALLRELLRQASLSRIPIARLAMQCGFSDAAHAARSFKGFYGVTPREYRGMAPDGLPPVTPLS